MANDWYIYMKSKGYKNFNDHRKMGLDNQICKHPTHFCSLKQVYLSEDDVKKRNCKNKQTFDMMSVYLCGNLKKIEK